jgi:hypothetical protein
MDEVLCPLVRIFALVFDIAVMLPSGFLSMHNWPVDIPICLSSNHISDLPSTWFPLKYNSRAFIVVSAFYLKGF